MNKLCLALLIAFGVPSITFAGGGGTKGTGTVVFKNTGGNHIYIIVDPPSKPTPETFSTLGGRKFNTQTTFKLKAGSHTYYYLRKAGSVFPTQAEIDAAAEKPKQFKLSNGETKTIDLD